MKDWGITFVSPTAKNHDGFALWFSKVSPYDMEVTPFNRDIMRELGNACRKHGIGFGTCYSNMDWCHPDWTPYQHGGPGPLYLKKNELYSIRRGNTAWLFIESIPSSGTIELASLETKVKAITNFPERTTKVKFSEAEGILSIDARNLAKPAPFTVIQLTFEDEVEMSEIKTLPNVFERAGGKLLTSDYKLSFSSKSPKYHNDGQESYLLEKPVGEGPSYVIHTNKEKKPYIQIDLEKERNLQSLVVHNRSGGFLARTKNLALATSNDGQLWKTICSANGKQKQSRTIEFTSKKMGANVLGRKYRYLRLFINQSQTEYLSLYRVFIYEIPEKNNRISS